MHFAAGPQARRLGASDEHTRVVMGNEPKRRRTWGPQPEGARRMLQRPGKIRIRSIRLLLLPFLLSILFCSGAGYAQDDSPGRDTLVIQRHQDIAEEVIVFSRSVSVQGVARQGVAAFGGSVTVNGIVRGDVAVVGGTLKVEDGGIVHGDVIVIGGKLERDPLGRIDGRVFSTSIYEEKLVNMFTQPSKELLAVDYSVSAIGWRVLRTFTWFLLALVLLKVFPLQINSAARVMIQNPARISGVGILSTVALVTALFLFLVLCIVVIGVPLLIIWLLFCLAAWIFGSVVVYYAFGQFMGRSFFKGRSSSPAVFVLVGVLSCGLLRMIPILTFVLPYIVLVLGLGAVISTKFGTGAPWFRKVIQETS